MRGKTQEEHQCRIYLRTNIQKKAHQVVVVNEYPGQFSATRSTISGESRGHLKKVMTDKIISCFETV